MFSFDALEASLAEGLVDPEIFHREDLYKLELERVFGRCWLFVAHESMLKATGDYITTFMGEDPVIVTRDGLGKIRVFLNRCRHRGVQVCPLDRGNAKSFSCPYHGWTYGLDGALNNVPLDFVYGGALDTASLGLIEVPKVSSYGGFVFANLDAGAMSLDEYLGDMRYYFDNMFGRLDAGGVEMSPIKQRGISHHNWKIAADNGSDMYHVAMTHAGGISTLQDFAEYVPEDGGADAIYLSTAGGAPHSVLATQWCTDAEGYDLRMAKQIDKESVDYVKSRHASIRQKDPRIAPGYLAVATIFPTLLFVDVGPLTTAVAIELWHPKGPDKTETWVYQFVEKDAPQSLKEFSARQMMRFHSLSGSIVPDDHENWERFHAGSRGTASRRVSLNYSQGLGDFHGSDNYRSRKFDGLPGDITYGISERGARELYKHWLTLMREA